MRFLGLAAYPAANTQPLGDRGVGRDAGSVMRDLEAKPSSLGETLIAQTAASTRWRIVETSSPGVTKMTS